MVYVAMYVRSWKKLLQWGRPATVMDIIADASVKQSSYQYIGIAALYTPHIYSFIHLSFMPLEALRYRASHHRKVCQLHVIYFLFNYLLEMYGLGQNNPQTYDTPLEMCLSWQSKSGDGNGWAEPSYHMAWNRARIQTESWGQEKTKPKHQTALLPFPFPTESPERNPKPRRQRYKGILSDITKWRHGTNKDGFEIKQSLWKKAQKKTKCLPINFPPKNL